jgi:hypothetical protein
MPDTGSVHTALDLEGGFEYLSGSLSRLRVGWRATPFPLIKRTKSGCPIIAQPFTGACPTAMS